MKTSHKQS